MTTTKSLKAGEGNEEKSFQEHCLSQFSGAFDKAAESYAGKVGHTPLPWSASLKAAGGNRTYGICTDAAEFKDDERWPYHPLVASVYRGHGHAPLEIAQANAVFIVKACNSHDELVEALTKASELISSLHQMTQDGDIDKNSHVGPSLTLKTAVKKLAPELVALLDKAKGGAS